MTLVLYNAEKDRLALYDERPDGYWMEDPYVVWKDLNTCFERGWEVIGEL